MMYDNEVTLSDGKRYLFENKVTCYFDPRSNSYKYNGIIRKFYVKTIEQVTDEDWKTALAQNKKSIPAGTILEVEEIYTNFYGRFIVTHYKGSHYYIDPSKVEYVKSEIIKGE